MADKMVSVSRVIKATPEAIFDVLADPARHAEIDGSGMVQNIRGESERLALGSKFGMDMKMGPMPYRISNTVKEFEENRLIAWAHFGGHRWRYELEPVEVDGGAATEVTESFDWSTCNPGGRQGHRARRLPQEAPGRTWRRRSSASPPWSRADPRAPNHRRLLMTADAVHFYWRPGCGFCSMLRRGLDKAGIETVDHNIWDDPADAAVVRALRERQRDGADRRGRRRRHSSTLRPSRSAAICANHAPHLLPDDFEEPKPGLVGRLLGG